MSWMHERLSRREALSQGLALMKAANRYQRDELEAQADPDRCNCCGRIIPVDQAGAWFKHNDATAYCALCNHSAGTCCNVGPMSYMEIELAADLLSHIVFRSPRFERRRRRLEAFILKVIA